VSLTLKKLTVYFCLQIVHKHYKFFSRMDGLLGELWLEVGSISLGPLVIEAAMSLPAPEHNLHLVQHR
jgi:hypothetical protein